MPPTYLLARDHLEQAASILNDGDTRSRQLRHIIERTIGLLDEFRREEGERRGNVVDFAEHRRARRIAEHHPV